MHNNIIPFIKIIYYIDGLFGGKVVLRVIGRGKFWNDTD